LFIRAWLPLIIALVLNASANVLMKVGSQVAKARPAAEGLGGGVCHFLNAATIAGIVLFAANVLVYRKALDSLDISVAYPVMVSVGLILVAVSAAALPILSERISTPQIFGMVLIAAGVWLVASGQG